MSWVCVLQMPLNGGYVILGRCWYVLILMQANTSTSWLVQFYWKDSSWCLIESVSAVHCRIPCFWYVLIIFSSVRWLVSSSLPARRSFHHTTMHLGSKALPWAWGKRSSQLNVVPFVWENPAHFQVFKLMNYHRLSDGYIWHEFPWHFHATEIICQF